jgi:hypothetical protein
MGRLGWGVGGGWRGAWEGKLRNKNSMEGWSRGNFQKVAFTARASGIFQIGKQSI